MSVDIPYVTISIGPTVNFASETTISSIVASIPPPERAQWQKSKDRNVFHNIDVRKSKYFGSNVIPTSPLLVIPKTTFDDKLYYRLQILNKIWESISNDEYLNVTGSMSFKHIPPPDQNGDIFVYFSRNKQFHFLFILREDLNHIQLPLK